jgi:tetratricopeptide (TPR) repeat protein
VFVSHTSELQEFPAAGSYVAAVERAIAACGHVVVDMAGFPAADQAPAELCRERVRSCDVYVGVLGTRYGSPVRDEPEISYTELEFDTATEASLPRLVFLLDTSAADVGIPPSGLIDVEFGARQAAFRARVQEAGLVIQSFTAPATLGQLVERSLRELTEKHRRAGGGAGRSQPLTYYYAPRPPISWPQRIGVIPSEADNFQHRKAVEDLDAAMADSEAAVICQVLSGTGGVGKTQLAAHYARHKWSAEQLDLLVWVTAGNRDAIVSAYARAGKQLAGADDSEPVDAAEEFLTWLETTDRRWLVVLDDLAAPGDLSGLWPPRHSTGRTIVTTRRRDAALFGTGRRLVAVDLFTVEEASNYLTVTLAAHDRRDDPDQIRSLAKDLGLLPLALAQAAAYVIDRQLGCAQYRQRFADRRRTLAELLPEKGALPDEQRATVAATWSLSIELADQLFPPGLARPMLELTSVLDANGIPITVLTSPPALEYLSSHRTPVSTDFQTGSPHVLTQVSTETAREALHCLHRLNLADFADDSGERGLRVHSLIQRATRDQLTADEFGKAVHASARALLHVWGSTQTIAESAILRANAEALHLHAGPQLWSLGVHPVLFEAGRSLSKDRHLVATATYWQQLRLEAELHLGLAHPDTVLARIYAASSRGVTGDLADAVTALEELVADLLRIHGPDHPHSLSARAALADQRGAAGDRDGAITAWEELVADRQRVHGPDHPDTLSARAALADQRAAAGDRDGAITAWEELVADRQRVHGPDDHRTLSARAVLADQRAAAGDRDGAITALEELLAAQLRVHGPDHPRTLSTRDKIVKWRSPRPRSPGRLARRSESQPSQPLRAEASGGSYMLRWRAADGTEQSMGPFSDAHTVEEVGRWVRQGKGTAVEIVKEPGGETPG